MESAVGFLTVCAMPPWSTSNGEYDAAQIWEDYVLAQSDHIKSNQIHTDDDDDAAES